MPRTRTHKHIGAYAHVEMTIKTDMHALTASFQFLYERERERERFRVLIEDMEFACLK